MDIVFNTEEAIGHVQGGMARRKLCIIYIWKWTIKKFHWQNLADILKKHGS